MMKRVFALILAGALSVSLFAGCGGNKEPAAEGSTPAASGEASEGGEGAAPAGEIVFWTQDTAPWKGWFDPAIEAFQQQNPDIKVKVEYFPQFADKLTQAYAAGQQPDVAQTWQGITHWAKAGKLDPVPDSVYSKEDMQAKFYEGALKNKEFEGQYYCIPAEINVESPGLLVNMDLLEKMGKTLPDGWVENNGPKSWDELLSFAKELTVKSGDTITQSGLAYAYAQWEAMFVSLIWQNGGDYRDEANSVVHFNTPEAKKAAEFMLKYANPADPDVICDIGASRYELFIQGTAAMVMGAPWYAGSLATDAPDMNYQYFNMPAMVDGSDPYCMATGGWGYIVSAESKNKPAAWEFVKQMTTPEQIGSWALGVGSLAAHKEANADLEYDPNVGSVEKALAVSKDILQYGNEDGAYTLDSSQLIYTIVRQQLQQMVETGDIDTALATMEMEGNDMIETNLNR